jgi:tetraacyldisaccharide 4'-kinase
MLQRRLADTTTKLGIGANRAAVASSMLQKYGYVNPCDAFLGEKLSSAHNQVVTGTSAKIGVAILDDGMQVSSIYVFFSFIDYLYGSIHQYCGFI